MGVVLLGEPGEEVGGASWTEGEEVGLEGVELLLPLEHLRRSSCKDL